MSTNLNALTISADALRAASVEDTLSMIDRAGALYAKRGSEDTIRAAKSTFSAYAKGILVDRGGDKFDHTVTTKAYAAKFGLTSHGNVPAWRVLGTAILRVGISDETRDAIIGKNLAQYPAVIAAVNAEDATPESVAEAVADSLDADGNRKSVTRPARPKTGGETLGSVASDEGKLVPVGRDLAGLSALMVGVVSVLSTLSDADYAKGVEMISTRLAEVETAKLEAATAPAA